MFFKSLLIAAACAVGMQASAQGLVPLPPQPGGLAWPTESWPEGEVPAGVEEELSLLVRDAMATSVTEPMGQTRAIVIIHEGRLIFETYAEGFGPDTKQVSWSMAKSIDPVQNLECGGGDEACRKVAFKKVGIEVRRLDQNGASRHLIRHASVVVESISRAAGRVERQAALVPVIASSQRLCGLIDFAGMGFGFLAEAVLFRHLGDVRFIAHQAGETCMIRGFELLPAPLEDFICRETAAMQADIDRSTGGW